MCVLRCLVRFADLGNVFPQYLHPYLSPLEVPVLGGEEGLLLVEDEDEDEVVVVEGERICLRVFCTVMLPLGGLEAEVAEEAAADLMGVRLAWWW